MLIWLGRVEPVYIAYLYVYMCAVQACKTLRVSAITSGSNWFLENIRFYRIEIDLQQLSVRRNVHSMYFSKMELKDLQPDAYRKMHTEVYKCVK